jgi:hypothetical protein
VTLSEAIAASRDRSLVFEDVRALVLTYPGTQTEALEEIALEVAGLYAARQLDFAAADALANSMFAYAAQHDCLGDILHSVFLAFDAGEFVPRTDPGGTDPEAKYTRPQIAKIIATVGRSNKSLGRTRGG